MATAVLKKENPALFQKHWDTFVEEQKVSPRYTTLALLNFLEMSESKTLLRDDQSFVLVQNDKPVAVAFVPIEEIESRRQITFNDSYVIAPLFVEDRFGKEAFSLIDGIAIREKVTKIKFAIDALESLQYHYNYLLRFGYLDSSVLNYLIDISSSVNLLDNCRKGHRSNIKQLKRNSDFSFFIADAKNPDYTLHEAYRALHHKAAGRVTRSKTSFDSQFTKLKAGLAAIFGISYQGKIIAASYFEMHGTKVLYGSAAEDPEFGKFPLYHSMVFSAMEYFQKHGYSWIEVSQPFNSSVQFDYYPTEKQRAIGLFKRGFGGCWVNDFRGIKYFDQALFEKESENFKKQYRVASSTIEEHTNEE